MNEFSHYVINLSWLLTKISSQSSDQFSPASTVNHIISKCNHNQNKPSLINFSLWLSNFSYQLITPRPITTIIITCTIIFTIVPPCSCHYSDIIITMQYFSLEALMRGITTQLNHFIFTLNIPLLRHHIVQSWCFSVRIMF